MSSDEYFENGPCSCADPTRVHEILAWVAEDEKGEEGIIAMQTGIGIVPCLGADRERVMRFRNYAIDSAKVRGKPVMLRRFHVVGDIETLQP